MSPGPTIFLDEQLFGLEVFLKDLGWKPVKVKPKSSDDEVLASAKENGYVPVTKDANLARRLQSPRGQCDRNGP